LGAIPSVRAVTIGSDMPLGGTANGARITLPGAEQTIRYYRHSADQDFFSALGVRVTNGRAFTGADRTGAPPVVIISESMARRFWHDDNPIGKRLRVGDARGAEVTIVGVVGDVRFRDLTTPLATSEPDIYFPLAQRTPAELQVAVRSDVNVETLTSSVRRELSAIDPTIPLFGIQPLESMLAGQTSSGRFASAILSIFGVAALVLTAVGLYGVLAFLVGLRQREIGIRLALGATNGRVLTGVIGQGVRLVGIGLAVGLVTAAGAARVIATQLYGVGAHDPAVFLAVPAVLLGVAVLASSLPARRASRVDPQIALRSE
jgi:predicted permease